MHESTLMKQSIKSLFKSLFRNRYFKVLLGALVVYSELGDDDFMTKWSGGIGYKIFSAGFIVMGVTLIIEGIFDLHKKILK